MANCTLGTDHLIYRDAYRRYRTTWGTLSQLMTSRSTARVFVDGLGPCVFQGADREDGSGESFNVRVLPEDGKAVTIHVRTR